MSTAKATLSPALSKDATACSQPTAQAACAIAPSKKHTVKGALISASPFRATYTLSASKNTRNSRLSTCTGGKSAIAPKSWAGSWDCAPTVSSKGRLSGVSGANGTTNLSLPATNICVSSGATMLRPINLRCRLPVIPRREKTAAAAACAVCSF